MVLLENLDLAEILDPVDQLVKLDPLVTAAKQVKLELVDQQETLDQVDPLVTAAKQVKLELVDQLETLD